jgi:hypothetical protein
MSATKTLAVVAKSAGVLLLCLIIADIIGVVVCTVFDVAPVRGGGDGVAYAVWLVLGIFCGLIAYNAAGTWVSGGTDDWEKAPGARRIGTVIMATGAALLASLTLFFHRLYWSQGVAGEYYVPDSAPHSILFFLSVLAGMILAGMVLTPGGKTDNEGQ